MATQLSRRRGFTLVELLVVIALLLILAALAVLIVPGMTDNARAARGGTQVQQWLSIARQRAVRDRAPRGVRLLIEKGSTIPVVTQLQFIEQPDDFVVQPGVETGPAGVYKFRRLTVTGNVAALEPVNKAVFPGPPPDFTGGQADPKLWPVQPGDYLELNGVGLPHRINKVNPESLELDSPVPVPVPLTVNYRILRAPRVAGEEPLVMPADIVIDLATNATYGQPLPVDPVTGTVDILFAPSGAVIGRGTSADTIFLWVRDVTLPLFERDNTIVAIFTRTGAVAAHPANKNGADPYSLAKDGRGSGL